MRRWPTMLAWCLTRAFVVVLLTTQERDVVGDVGYYRDSLASMAASGPGGTLTEYPVPALVLLWLPYALLRAVHHLGAYVAVIAVLAIVTDLVFHLALVHARTWRAPSARTWLGIGGAEWAWLLAVPALGATTYARFDLIPGILVGLAVLYVVHRPAVAAAFGSLATAVKYWPALILPAVAAPRLGRRRVLVTIAAVGGVMAVGSLAVGGWRRLWTPFDYQDARGLQIESVFATPAMLAWGHGSRGYATFYSTWKAYDVVGPMVDTLLSLASIFTLVFALLTAVSWVVAWSRLRRGADAAEALVWLVLASIGGFMVTNKVLSPQYLLWLLPAAAAGLVVLEGHGRAWRGLVWWTAGLLVATLLTHEVFPRHYAHLIVHTADSLRVAGLLALRNLLLIGLTGYAAWRTGRLLARPAGAGPERGAEAPSPAGTTATS